MVPCSSAGHVPFASGEIPPVRRYEYVCMDVPCGITCLAAAARPPPAPSAPPCTSTCVCSGEHVSHAHVQPHVHAHVHTPTHVHAHAHAHTRAHACSFGQRLMKARARILLAEFHRSETVHALLTGKGP